PRHAQQRRRLQVQDRRPRRQLPRLLDGLPLLRGRTLTGSIRARPRASGRVGRDDRKEKKLARRRRGRQRQSIGRPGRFVTVQPVLHESERVKKPPWQTSSLVPSTEQTTCPGRPQGSPGSESVSSHDGVSPFMKQPYWPLQCR